MLFNRGNVKGTNSSTNCVLCLCIHVRRAFFNIKKKRLSVGFVVVVWIDLKGLHMRRVLNYAFAYDRFWLSRGDPVRLTGR